MPRGLVDIEVDRHEELESCDRAIEPRAVGRGEHRVAAMRHERAHLPRSWRLDLLGECRHRQLASELGQPAHAALPPTETRCLRRPLVGMQKIDRGPREHRAPLGIEPTAHEVERIDQPGRHTAELLHRHAHTPVGHGARRGGKVARECAHHVGIHADRRGHALRREPCRELAQLRDAISERLKSPRLREPFGEHHLQQRQQQQRITARPDEVMRVGQRGRFGTSRIDHHNASAARPYRRESIGDAGRRHEAAVRHRRIGAEDQQMVGAVQIGDRDQQRMTEHHHRRDVRGQLVDRGRRVAVLRLECTQQVGHEEHRTERVHGGVAHIRGHRVPTVRALNVLDPVDCKSQRFVPRDALPLRSHALHGMAHAIGIGVHVLQRHGLGADVSLAQGIGGVTADVRDTITVGGDDEAAHGLAERAGAQVARRHTAVRPTSIRISRHFPPLNRRTVSSARIMCPQRIASHTSAGCSGRVSWIAVSIPIGIAICETSVM